MKYAAGCTTKDLEKFSVGEPHNALSAAPDMGIWDAMHRAHNEGLMRADSTQKFTSMYQKRLSESLATSPVDQWITVGVSEMLKKHMATTATWTLFGSRMLEMYPDVMEVFWKWELYAESLAFGLPRWMNARAVSARDRFRSVCSSWYEMADQEYNWDAEKESPQRDWEPIFGSPFIRDMARWGKQFGLSSESLGATFALVFFG
jgi:hypothetical protein